MAKTRTIWAQRVAEWRASGLTSTLYSEGKPFTPGALRQWAYQLAREQREQPNGETIRLGRVVRGQAAMTRPALHESAASPAAPETLIVEIGVARVAVRPGFDGPTLTAVLEVLAAAARSTR